MNSRSSATRFSLSAPILVVLLLSGTAAAPEPGRAVQAGAKVSRILAAEQARAQAERQTIRLLVDQHRGLAEQAWRQRLADAIYEEAVAAHVDPLMVAAIVARESSFRSRVVSRAGAVGLMQLRPFVARELAANGNIEWRGRETLHLPEVNVRLGAAYYRQLVERFDGDTRLALAAYHRGPTRLQRQLRGGPLGESRYVSNVLELYTRLDTRRRDLLVRS